MKVGLIIKVIFIVLIIAAIIFSFKVKEDRITSLELEMSVYKANSCEFVFLEMDEDANVTLFVKGVEIGTRWVDANRFFLGFGDTFSTEEPVSFTIERVPFEALNG